MPYFQIQAQNSNLTGGRLYGTQGFVGKGKMSDEAIAALAENGAKVGSVFSQIEVLHQGGAAGRVAPDATAYPHRTQSYAIQPVTLWMDPADDEREIAWSRNTYAALKPYMTGGHYFNVMDPSDILDPSDASDVARGYGAALTRLRKVKRAYDPDNTFRLNANVRPA
jgi:FAD/FMN-containing dehydrogenase